MRDETLTGDIIGSAIDVHRALGPGLLESAYEACLAYELVRRGHGVERQKSLPIQYGDVRIDAGYRIDMLVDDRVVVELKALSGKHVGLIINFHVQVLKSGIRRLVL